WLLGVVSLHDVALLSRECAREVSSKTMSAVDSDPCLACFTLGHTCRIRKKLNSLICGDVAEIIDNPVRPIAGQSARVMAIHAKYQRKVPALPGHYPRNGIFRDTGFARIGWGDELG